ncbi:MAG: hypothetical protein M3N43_06695 [Actinomycetota bacterium]|nr:hypothetical protein [Actinomycetota bacterium]
MSQLAAEVPAGFILVATTYVYAATGLEALALLAVAQLAFQFYYRQMFLSERRADELQSRNEELSALHRDLSVHTERISALSASRGGWWLRCWK